MTWLQYKDFDGRWHVWSGPYDVEQYAKVALAQQQAKWPNFRFRIKEGKKA